MPSETLTLRQLTNPPARREIRPGFPRTINVKDSEEIFAVLERELKKYGTDLDQVGYITLAYPHKHPDLFPGHKDNAKLTLGRFQQTVREAVVAGKAPDIEWLVADGLVETVHLERSENQSSVHALMTHQIYDIHKPSQKKPLPFLTAQRLDGLSGNDRGQYDELYRA
jgi:hypothetical protein